jgi:hypothetical protein
MGYPTKIQTIKRKQNEQWYINFPAALAQACEFEYGEMAEWILEDRTTLILKRTGAAELARGAGLKKKRSGNKSA